MENPLGMPIRRFIACCWVRGRSSGGQVHCANQQCASCHVISIQNVGGFPLPETFYLFVLGMHHTGENLYR